MRYLFLALIVAAVADAQPPDERESIVAFYQQFSLDSASLGPDGYAAHFTEDASLLPPGEPSVTGRAAIRAYDARLRSERPFTVQLDKLSVGEITMLSPVVAAHRSTQVGRLVPKNGGPAVPFETKYLDILQKPTTSGKWQFRYRMWSDNAPPPK